MFSPGRGGCFLPCYTCFCLPKVAVSFLQPPNAPRHGHEDLQHSLVAPLNPLSPAIKTGMLLCVHSMDGLERMHLAGEGEELSAPSAKEVAAFISKGRFRCNVGVLALGTE